MHTEAMHYTQRPVWMDVFFTFLAAILFVSALVLASISLTTTEAPETLNLYEKSYHSIVRFVDESGKTRASGVVIDAERGLILTNEHVTRHADRLHIATYAGEYSSFETLWESTYYDLALVDAKDGMDVREARLADTVPELGEEVYAIGHPVGQEYRITYGRVSAHVDTHPFPDLHGSLPIDLKLAPGNSGGGLFNMDGELVGIPNVLWFNGGSFGGPGYLYSYAVPISNIKVALNNK